MNLFRCLVLLSGLFVFSGAFGGTAEKQFWIWFETNEKSLFAFEKDRDRVFDDLSKQMKKVNPDLTFEFGPVNDKGKREFVISAGGMAAAFPAVEALFDSAPKLARWQFVKYRPRRSPISDLEYGGKLVKTKDVHYGMFKDGNKVGLILFFEGYNEAEKNVFGNIGFLFLDQALGEYDVETKIGFIEFHGRDSKHYQNARPLEELAKNFDAHFLGKGK